MNWEDLSELEQYAQIYSDVYKDVYGFRPRGLCKDWTLPDYKAELAALQVELDRQLAEGEK